MNICLKLRSTQHHTICNMYFMINLTFHNGLDLFFIVLFTMYLISNFRVQGLVYIAKGVRFSRCAQTTGTRANAHYPSSDFAVSR